MRKRQGIPLGWKTYLVAVATIAATVVVTILACNTAPVAGDPESPTYAPRIYIGSPNDNALVRAQDGEQIACSSDSFEGMVAMPAEDFICMYKNYIANCKEYYEPQVDCGQ